MNNKVMINKIREHFLTIFGVIFPGSFSIYNLIEQTTPILAWIGLLISISVGITALINNIKKLKKRKNG